MDLRDDGVEDHAFTTTDLWRQSLFTVDIEGVVSKLPHFAGRAIGKGLFDIGLSDLRLPDLESFQYGVLDDIPDPESVIATSDNNSINLNNGNEEDSVWSLDECTHLDRQGLPGPSWESFHDRSFKEPAGYLSDCKAQIFDAVLASKVPSYNTLQSDHHTFRHEPAVHALKLLAVGLSSWLFECIPETGSYQPRYPSMTLSGLSQPLSESLSKFFIELGTSWRKLQALVDKTSSSKHASSVAVALATAISKSLEEISLNVSAAAGGAQSLMEIQHAYERPRLILRLLWELTDDMQANQDGVAIMYRVYDYACRTETEILWARPLILALLNAASVPWLRAMNCCLGITSQNGCDNQLITRIEEQARHHLGPIEDISSKDAIPAFISTKDRTLILETCNSLSLLRKHDSTHSLADPNNISGPRLKLRWIYRDSELQRNLSAIHEYESTIRKMLECDPSAISRAIDSHLTPKSTSLDPFNQPIDCLKRDFQQTLASFEQLPQPDHDEMTSEIIHAVRLSFSQTDTTAAEVLYPLSLAPHLSFAPVVESQHRLLGQACLHMLLEKYNLREHLLLQRRYHLFGDGIFASRLAQSLFSDELSVTRGREDYSQAGSHGLRLGDRTTWPPGGSELRLVLMGILSESYYGTYSSLGSRIQDLPGNLSFGIRHLSESEIEAVMDPHSLSALDFLRLQYTSPAPLNTILTESAMDKYDKVFKFLLRVSRLLAVTVQMAPRRGSSKEHPLTAHFRVAASRFIEAISGYFLHAAVALPWARFEARLAGIDASLHNAAGPITSVSELRSAHDAMLDAILFGLLLRHRQEPVLHLLEEIFTTILRFSRLWQLGHEPRAQEEILRLYSTFRAKTQTFVTVCRGLSGKKSYTAGFTKDTAGSAERLAAEGGGIEQLLLRLDMNGWWTRHD